MDNLTTEQIADAIGVMIAHIVQGDPEHAMGILTEPEMASATVGIWESGHLHAVDIRLTDDTIYRLFVTQAHAGQASDLPSDIATLEQLQRTLLLQYHELVTTMKYLQGHLTIQAAEQRDARMLFLANLIDRTLTPKKEG